MKYIEFFVQQEYKSLSLMALKKSEKSSLYFILTLEELRLGYKSRQSSQAF